jgi:hypothetical protein
LCDNRDKSSYPIFWNSKRSNSGAREEDGYQEKELDFNMYMMQRYWRVLSMAGLLGVTMGRWNKIGPDWKGKKGKQLRTLTVQITVWRLSGTQKHE